MKIRNLALAICLTLSGNAFAISFDTLSGIPVRPSVSAPALPASSIAQFATPMGPGLEGGASPIPAVQAVGQMEAQVEDVLAKAPAGPSSQDAAKIANIVTGGKDAAVVDAPVVSVEGDEAGETALAQEIQQKSAFVPKYREEFSKAIVGQPEMRDSLLISLLTGGHVLLEGVPGVAKTRAVKALGKIVGLTSGRIQFTRDLMPADIVGQEEKNRKTDEWEIRKGPIFVNVLLADEINRAKGMTQSGLLEAMEEGQVTIAGEQMPLPNPFVVLATQNPIEEEGVHPLPKAQLDRFMFKLNVGKPSGQELTDIIGMNLARKDLPVEQVISREQLMAARGAVRRVIVSKDVRAYISRIVDETDPLLSKTASVKQSVHWGASPRAGNWIAKAAQAQAFMDGRYYVIPEDVQAVAARVLRHRLILNFEAEGRVSPDAVVADILRTVPSVKVTMKFDPKNKGVVSRILGAK